FEGRDQLFGQFTQLRFVNHLSASPAAGGLVSTGIIMNGARLSEYMPSAAPAAAIHSSMVHPSRRPTRIGCVARPAFVKGKLSPPRKVQPRSGARARQPGGNKILQWTLVRARARMLRPARRTPSFSARRGRFRLTAVQNGARSALGNAGKPQAFDVMLQVTFIFERIQSAELFDRKFRFQRQYPV